MRHAPETPDNSDAFAAQAVEVILKLRKALSDVVVSLPGVRVRRPNDLANCLGIDPKLAWRVSKVINGTDPFGAALHIPGRSGMRILLEAAGRHGAPQGLIEAAKAAYAEFVEVVHVHAGDRRTFDMLMAGHAKLDRRRGELYHRKLMFQGMSYIWGVQVRVQTLTAIAAPSDDPMMLDAAVLKTYADLRRIRPNVPWRITRTYTADALGEVRTALVREPLDPSIDTGGDGPALPLLTEFCSKPLPECRRVEGVRGVVDYQLVEGAVGNTACLTIATGEVVRAVEPRYRTDRYQAFNVDFILRTPAELLVFDLLLDRQLWEPMVPTLGFYSDLFAEGIEWPRLECDRLPIHERIEYLGTGLENIAVPELPRYAEMVRYAFDRLGWDPDRFDVYRVRMSYPPIPTGILMRRDLPPPPR